MASTNPFAAHLTLSGRELALQRRVALSRSGKAALASSVQRLRSAAATAPSIGCGCDGGCTADGCKKASSASPYAAELRPASATTPAAAIADGSAKALARARRAALATGGKGALPKVLHSSLPAVHSIGAIVSTQRPAAAVVSCTSGRGAAMQRRQARALQGDSSGAAQPSGRVRRNDLKAPLAAEAGQTHTQTPAARPVTGTVVNSTRHITGTEPGESRRVTGIAYLGAELLQGLHGTQPPAGATQLALAQPPREQKITGTELGISLRVTGDEPGAGRAVTGTEYLVRDPVDTASGTKPPTPPARKISVMSAPGALDAFGAPIERSVKVTGDEHGATRALTGTSSDTGSRVTGDQSRLYKAVIDGSASPMPPVRASVPEIARVAKAEQDTTWRGQSITGSQLDRSARVTGDEPGACSAVSGTPYIGRRQYDSFCEPPQRALQQAQAIRGTTISAAAVTGDRPGAGGSNVTGDERGACGPVSGTPYVGLDNRPARCPPATARFVPRDAIAPVAPALPAPSDFSIHPPARQARDRNGDGHDPITGSDFTSSRITGPINKAAGLITGTPEFRHAEPGLALRTTSEAQTAATRLTGEGSQSGTRVSGDAWQGKGRVTGTEGTSSLGRNPSQRGQPRGMGMNALRFRDQVERTEPPPSPVTGSAGSAARGAAVTVSGGARA